MLHDPDFYTNLTMIGQSIGTNCFRCGTLNLPELTYCRGCGVELKLLPLVENVRGQLCAVFTAVGNSNQWYRFAPVEGVIVISRLTDDRPMASTDWSIKDKTVTRYLHATLAFAGSHWALKDHCSTNGTYIDGSRISTNRPSILSTGRLVKFGSVLFSFSYEYV
jgi:hypothetical protein